MSGTTGVSVTKPEMKINIRENIYSQTKTFALFAHKNIAFVARILEKPLKTFIF